MTTLRRSLLVMAVLLMASACGADVDDDSKAPRIAVAITTEGCLPPQRGTGVAIEGDLVITAGHVIAGATSVEVTSWRGDTFEALPVLIDPDLDFAVLRVVGLDVDPAKIAEGDIGVTAAMAVPRSATRLLPASLVRVINANTTDIHRSHAVVKLALQLDIAAQAGDSGAPIVNGSGEIVGILVSTATAIGNSFALHVAEFSGLLDEVPENRAARGSCSR